MCSVVLLTGSDVELVARADDWRRKAQLEEALFQFLGIAWLVLLEKRWGLNMKHQLFCNQIHENSNLVNTLTFFALNDHTVS